MLFVFNAFVEKSTSAGNIPRILVNKRKDHVYSLHIYLCWLTSFCVDVLFLNACSVFLRWFRELKWCLKFT